MLEEIEDGFGADAGFEEGAVLDRKLMERCFVEHDTEFDAFDFFFDFVHARLERIFRFFVLQRFDLRLELSVEVMKNASLIGLTYFGDDIPSEVDNLFH